MALSVYAASDNVRAASLSNELRSASITVRDAYVYLHENPELGKQEFKTYAYLRNELIKMGFSEFVKSTDAPTAVVAVLDSGRPGPTIALRAEMDGRKLDSGDEPINHNPRSQSPGLMHNCGHDIHASILLGTARILLANKDRVSGKIVFLFQPAEETAGGADDIVRERILSGLGVSAISTGQSFSGTDPDIRFARWTQSIDATL